MLGAGREARLSAGRGPRPPGDGTGGSEIGAMLFGEERHRVYALTIKGPIPKFEKLSNLQAPGADVG
jgi:hypothetical protein